MAKEHNDCLLGNQTTRVTIVLDIEADTAADLPSAEVVRAALQYGLPDVGWSDSSGAEWCITNVGLTPEPAVDPAHPDAPPADPKAPPAVTDEPEWSCPNCGGNNVELSYPCWIPANNPDERSEWEPDFEASPHQDSDKGWCKDCEETILIVHAEAG